MSDGGVYVLFVVFVNDDFCVVFCQVFGDGEVNICCGGGD